VCGTNRRTRLIIDQEYTRNNFGDNQNQLESKIQANTNNIYCHNCSFSQNIQGATFCNQCGFELKICPISKMKFSINQETVQCMNCNWIFHKMHMDSWMLKKQSCPVCRASPDQMILGKVGN
jgi:uncharacterized paraquat-inducible protein A